MKTKKIIFWVVVAVLIIGLGFWFKYAPFGAAGVVLGWIARILYCRYIKE